MTNMRKKSYFTNSPEHYADLMAETIGRVGLITNDGYARIIPVNFVERNRIIYFHGALEGEKFELFSQKPKVTFQVEKTYSLIPSYWLGEKNGCTATIFYKSLYAQGTGSMVEDKGEKFEALQLLMEKDQGEGGYLPFKFDEPLYQKNVAQTGIYRLELTMVDMKIKFGQNRSDSVRRDLISKLKERGSKLDLATASEIEKTL